MAEGGNTGPWGNAFLHHDIQFKDPFTNSMRVTVGKKTRELIPASCDATVEKFDAANGTLIFTCSKCVGPAGHAEATSSTCKVGDLQLATPAGIQNLGVNIGDDPAPQRLMFSPTAVAFPNAARIFSFTDHKNHNLESGDTIVELGDAFAVIVRANKLLVYDYLHDRVAATAVDDVKASFAPGSVSREIGAIRRGNWLAARGAVIDLAQGSVRGHYQGEVFGLADDGSVLRVTHPQWDSLAGPVYWEQVQP